MIRALSLRLTFRLYCEVSQGCRFLVNEVQHFALRSQNQDVCSSPSKVILPYAPIFTDSLKIVILVAVDITNLIKITFVCFILKSQ